MQVRGRSSSSSQASAFVLATRNMTCTRQRRGKRRWTTKPAYPSSKNFSLAPLLRGRRCEGKLLYCTSLSFRNYAWRAITHAHPSGSFSLRSPAPGSLSVAVFVAFCAGRLAPRKKAPTDSPRRGPLPFSSAGLPR